LCQYKKKTHTPYMTTIKIVGEDWCPFTKGTAAEKGAWLAAADLTGPQGNKNITYEKLDCKAAGLSPDDKKLCDVAQGFPSFMDADGNTCTRGFDRTVGFGDGTSDGITKTIQEALNTENKCA
jgi:hypothetical protein